MLQSPMSCFIQRLLKLAACLPLMLPPVALANFPVTCSIASIQIGTMTKSVPLSEPEYLGGHVDVLCTSASSQPLSVDFALLGVDGDTVRNGRDATSSIQVELFSDRALHKALPKSAHQVTDFPIRTFIASAGESKVSIPFHARVFLRTLTAAGDYNISRNIGLVYRVGSSR
jgi:hypothetical protein